MRYIGNKTRLLDFIGRTLRARGIRPGTAIDPFSGTASVARALKRWRFAVAASDIMQYGYVFARAYVEVVDTPSFDRLPGSGSEGADGLRGVLAYLNALPGRPGFIHEHFTPSGHAGAEHGRMYFTPVNAARIDAIREQIHEWHASGDIDDDGYHVLLAALIEAADRVANTTGVYAAFVKTWQPNALRSLQMRALRHVPGSGCRAMKLDAIAAVEQAGEFDLLYLDPPYNARQYAGYYHIPELIAHGWHDRHHVLRGKTGLIEDGDLRTAWSSSRRCEAVFEQLVESARCSHIVMSYNAEGIIPEPAIERVLKAFGRRGSYRRYRRGYRRYRCGSDSPEAPGADTVNEYLYCASR